MTSTELYGGLSRAESTTPMVWIEASIKKQNEYRALHGASPLVYNKELSEISQAYANHIAKTFKVVHNPDLEKGELGENLYFKSDTLDFELEPDTAVTGWYNEIHDYDFETGYPIKDGKEVLHFTQLVWKETTDVGVAYAKAVKPNGTHFIYVVANYFPQGNFDDFIENVIPK